MHKKRLLYTILALCHLVLFTTNTFSQNRVDAEYKATDKVGLTLSGGGAKGIAYIGLLKKIDSLGIRVSFITGTSMGGIIGGLYAAGYSGKQLEDIVRHIDWDRVLSNTTPLSKVNIEEKSEYGSYLLELPLKKGMPTFPDAAIEGQYLSQILNDFTFPVRDFNDFSKLSIPLRIATSDLVNGGTIFQQHGSLPLAIRATMSIPGVFSNVTIDGRLLVDGGVDRNYPVGEVRRMGANFVIGGYTGFHLLNAEQMNSPFSQLMQAFSFGSLSDIKTQIANTDLLVDYTDLLQNYSAADFNKYKEILRIGEIAADKYLPKLKQVADAQKAMNMPVIRPSLPISTAITVKYNFVTDKNEPIEDNNELEQLQQNWVLQPGKAYSSDEISAAVEKIYGSRRYTKVYYTFNTTAEGLEMNIHVKQAAKGYFKAAVHYDTEQSAGIVLNYTLYDLLLKSSRLLATVDATERLKVRVDYYKFLTKSNKVWIRANTEYRNLKSNDVLLSLLSTSDLNTSPPDYFNFDFKSSLSLGYSLSHSALVEAGLGYDAEKVYKSKSLASAILGLTPKNTIYRHNNKIFYVRLVQNTFSSKYYPVKGNSFEAEFRFFFNNRSKFTKSSDSGAISINQYLNPNSNLYTPNGLPGNVSRILFKDEVAIPINRHLTIRTSAFAGVITSSNFGAASGGYFYLNNYFKLGGVEQLLTSPTINFPGLKQSELPVRSLSVLNIAAQFSPVKRFYVTPTFSYGAEGNGYNVTANLFNRKSNFKGYGLHLGYMSIIGPVDLAVDKAEVYNIRFPLRTYLSFGYKF
ncbi:patatin-like phospholipase family protein [Mucilaginibacter sp. ZT4R22]|uniref:Patatin-like phospholipase family protein n=1 Tax=Mucilaginibacter pankratovii TaxID=2772110 RepID=A0ABR7WJY8_9SPHI|nr:patatin-like phospholipase family protein [Mucilaginibacter pankratovii]MBD1362635.1 patatin-like phospholipase family protein [Mucilaginibacter pankratovii]